MNIQIIETNDLRDFSPDNVHATSLLDTGKVRALLLNLEAGQGVEPCQMSVTVLYYVIAGQGHLRLADERAELHAGSITVAPAGAVRSISAVERMRVLAVQVL